MSACISKNLRWLNEQVKRVLRCDTRPVWRLYDFLVWLQCWLYHYYLLIWRCLSNYDVRYYVHMLNLIEAMFFLWTQWKLLLFAHIYMCLLFSAGLNFSIIYVSYNSLKILLSSQIAKNGIILKFPPPHDLIWPSASICCNSGCRICCL